MARLIAIILAAAMIVTSVTFLMSLGPGSYSYGASRAAQQRLDMQLQTLKSYIQLVHDQYKDRVDYDTLVDGAFSGVLKILDDPYSEYYIRPEAAEQFLDNANGSFYGVGLSLEMNEGQIRVVSAVPGTPASKAGILTGDAILKVDGASMEGKSLDDAIGMIRGEAGTTVRLTIMRDGKELSFALTREEIHLKSVAYEMLEGNIGYIMLASFDDDSDEEFTKAKKALLDAGAKSLIVDVRDNPGGLVDTAVNIAEQLMPAGPITHFMRQGKLIESYSATGKSYTKMPMALLVNGGSASASEILAAALQDSGSAAIVGVNTYGKGVGQYVMAFSDGSYMKLSTFYFMSPDKKPVNEVGVTPDYVVPLPVNEKREALLSEYLGFAPMSEKTVPLPGSVGLNVYGAQQRLEFLGYRTSPTGELDQATLNELARFQKNYGMPQNGSLDSATIKKLDAACAELIASTGTGKDLQLAKAIEILSSK
ncbi:MAG: S41 family peptidase [Clostridiales Family XIII bacterium]|jgi:carboxyl-terminal processing protease|nr:S41 family peptidase [Clostridiales Family XIII bacterium]